MGMEYKVIRVLRNKKRVLLPNTEFRDFHEKLSGAEKAIELHKAQNQVKNRILESAYDTMAYRILPIPFKELFK